MNKEIEAEAKALGARLLGGIPVFKRQLEDYLWSGYGIRGISVSRSYQNIWEQALLPNYGLDILVRICLAEMRKQLSNEEIALLKAAWESKRIISAVEYDAYPWEWKPTLLNQDTGTGSASWTDFANFFFKYCDTVTAPTKEEILRARERLQPHMVSVQEEELAVEHAVTAAIPRVSDHRDDIALLGLSPTDRIKLESMGIIGLEQIALHNRDSLGMGKAKGDSIIQRTWNILANRHIQGIDIDNDQITVSLDEINEAILAAVRGILRAYDLPDWGNCRTQTVGNRIILISRHGSDFSYIVEQAKKRQQILQARQRQSLKQLGVTLERERIIHFARQRGFDGFWQEVFSSISGNDTMKRALAIAMFSTYMEPVHILSIGEPGGGKTLSKDIIADNFLDLTKVGANTTRAGLVCNLSTGQPGALAFSDHKLVLVDEFDKIPEGDMEYCYELLSNGKCQIDSARIHDTIESHFIMIAFANPKYGVFHSSPLEEVGLPATLMSRFALVVKTEPLVREAMQKLFLSKFYGSSELQRLSDHYDQWVKLSRLHVPEIECSPDKAVAYVDKALDLVEKYQGTPLRRDPRMGDYLRRVPMSIARAEFRNVTDADLTSALGLFRQSVEDWVV